MKLTEEELGTWYTDHKLAKFSPKPFLLSFYLAALAMLSYVSFFVVNWFWAPFFLFLYSSLHTRLQAYHMLLNYRRAVPDRYSMAPDTILPFLY